MLEDIFKTKNQRWLQFLEVIRSPECDHGIGWLRSEGKEFEEKKFLSVGSFIQGMLNSTKRRKGIVKEVNAGCQENNIESGAVTKS